MLVAGMGLNTVRALDPKCDRRGHADRLRHVCGSHMSTALAGPSPTVKAIARATSPLTVRLSGHRLFPLWAVLHHTGRRSGRAYAIPVAIRASAETFTISLPWGERTDWVQNVIAAGGCRIRWRGADHAAVDPTVIGLAEAGAAFNPVQRVALRAAGVRSFLRLRRIPLPGEQRG
jgi:deazaflavin-dependent oxidoreductase (nitroreductase family)